jgi:hypothetical protein
MGTGSFPGVKSAGACPELPIHTYAEVKESVDLYLYALSALMACSRVQFMLYFI